MKRTAIFAATLFLAVILVLPACSDDDEPSAGQTPVIEVDSEGNTSIDKSQLEAEVEALNPGQLSTVEVDGLLFMREEEKLARDVYQVLGASSTQPIFGNIARSEETHMEAVRVLLDQYEIKDPALAAGKFMNRDLQALYDRLIGQGSVNQIEALKVGAAIEEIDLIDLEIRIAQTDEAAIKLVYENLEKGSRNHLRSFVSSLDRLGVTYAPIALTQAAYDAVVSSAMER